MAGGNPKDEAVVPDWAIDLYKSYGSPDLSTHDDVYVGPLIGRKSGLRKDDIVEMVIDCLLYTSPSPRDRQKSRMPSSA